MSVLLLFLDGLGLGPMCDTNPFSITDAPFLVNLLGGSLVESTCVSSDNIVLNPVDACLDVPGLPQSATGQTALFTGINAAAYLGYHLPAFPNTALKKIIDQNALLKRVVDAGGTATFANAYTPAYFELVREGRRVHSVTTLSVYAADLPFLSDQDMMAGRAVYWDITRRRFPNSSHPPVSPIDPREAGKHLAAIAARHDLTVFECFLSDLIGHRKDRGEAVRFIGILDRFLAGILPDLPSHCTLVLSSDHGNIEDLSCSVHTHNPVPLLAVGPAAGHFAAARSITDITPSVLHALGIEDREGKE
ncbi:MAG: phosphoglyceromutase [Chitinivibrionales bacterium]|nr:phosphoglyceromutase [Chitinivibrionales bacterium]MBD3358346.1 phosphoglyceromutase [Chitinivibrionales bacterium]